MVKQQAKRIFRIVFILASIASLWFVPWILVKAWILPLPNTIQEQVNESIKNGFDGIIVYIEQGGKPSEIYVAGWHDRKNKIPAKPNALFKIASITKLYNAVAITKLVNDQRLNLDKTLSDYFPELEGRIANAKEITLRMMVQHRSGIPNFTDHPGYWENRPKTREETLELVLDLPAKFAPNKKFEYSNTNYLLIEALMDKILGYSHDQFIKEVVLIPHGLNNTFSSLKDADIADVMSGYYIGYDEDLKNEEYGMLATAEDVGKFLRGLNDGSLFEEGEQEIYSSIYEYNHTGWIPGYQSIARYHADIDAVIIQFVNTTGGYNWNLLEITHSRIVKILKNQKSL